MVRHATAQEDKQARRDVILQAASRLFVEGDGRLPSAAQIAMAAGLAKGTVYLYFQTKEEIFSALLIAEIDFLLKSVATSLANARGQRTEKVAAFLDTYVRHIEQHPALLKLDALGYGVLERNLGPDKMLHFKATFLEGMTEAGFVIEQALKLSPMRGVPLLMRSFAMTRGLWQSSSPEGAHAPFDAAYKKAAIYTDFKLELREALTEYWRGALSKPA